MKTKNLTLPSGRPVLNQFIMYDDTKEIFQSYNSIICIRHKDGSVEFDEKYWDYSHTTIKYRNMFLDETSAIVKQK